MAANEGIGSSVVLGLFMMLLTLGFFLWPLMFRMLGLRMSKSAVLEMVLRRSCWILGLLFLTQSSATIFSMNAQFGVDAASDLIPFMRMFGYLAYLLIGYMVFRLVIDSFKLYADNKKEAMYNV